MSLEISDRSVSLFASELRACLSEILRGPVPEPAEADDPLRIFRQWLAERNLGLVPIADAPAFDWPGQWIAAFRDGEDEHALVMFGSPSGLWLDPSNTYHEGRRIEAGWMLTPIDLHLPTDQPYGTAAAAGTTAAILIAPDPETPLSRVDEAGALAGRGLVGATPTAAEPSALPAVGTSSHSSRPRCSTRSSSPGRRRAATSSPAESPSTVSSADALGSPPSNASAAGTPNLGDEITAIH
jgi:hypothetical protein